MSVTTPRADAGTARQYRDTPVDVKVVLAGLWTTMLFVFAYVDIFAYLRGDVLEAALDGEVATTGFTVDQLFLTLTLVYILVPPLMVAFSLLLKARVNRVVNVVVSGIYAVTIVVAAAGETWAYYLVGSAVEVLLLAAIAAIAWTWPAPDAEGRARHGHRSAQ